MTSRPVQNLTFLAYISFSCPQGKNFQGKNFQGKYENPLKIPGLLTLPNPLFFQGINLTKPTWQG